MKGIKDFFLFFIDQIHTNQIINFAAQMAYNVLLAFIPFAMIIHSFFNWLSSDWSMQISEKIQELLPPFMDALLESADVSRSLLARHQSGEQGEAVPTADLVARIRALADGTAAPVAVAVPVAVAAPEPAPAPVAAPVAPPCWPPESLPAPRRYPPA